MVGDEVSPVLERATGPEAVGKLDLILSCGDLPYDYLEYLVDAFGAPLLYVHGNHDHPIEGERGVIASPQGGREIEGKLVREAGLWVAGLGGSPRYTARGGYQYTEAEMRRRALALDLRLRVARLRGHGLDILLTHAPPQGIHDGPDPAHQGFAAFLAILERHRPRYHVHGHSYPRPGHPSRTRYGQTEVIHVRGHTVLEVPGG